MSKVPLHALPGFVAAARARNLSRAAHGLHLTVSALSHQMRGLEDQLGTRLFHRGPRGLALTESGERLFEAVAPHLDAIATALAPEPPRSSDSLTLSLMPSVASSWLVPRLPAFVWAHPEIELSLQSTVDVVDFERDDRIDAALRFGPGGWPGLRAHKLFDEWVLPVASPALLAGVPRGRRTPLRELPLLRDPGDRWRTWFARFGGTPPSRYVASFNDTETLHRAALEGVGVALGRLTMVRPLLDSGRLVALTRRRLSAEYAHWFVYPPRSERRSALVVFRAWLLRVSRGGPRAPA